MKLSSALFLALALLLLNGWGVSAFSSTAPNMHSRSANPPSAMASNRVVRVGALMHALRKNHEDGEKKPSLLLPQPLATTLAATALWSLATWANVITPNLIIPVAHAAESSRVVAQIAGSGLVMKDTLQVESFPDPKVRGVTLYVSNFQRPITERLNAKNFFTDPSSSSVACVKTGPIALADTINKSPAGEEVFQESKSLLFKSLRVQRVYDEATQTLIYVSFNTRLDKSDDSNKSRFQNSLCAIHIDNDETTLSKQKEATTASGTAAALVQ